MCTEKTIHDEEVSNVDIAESMAELKVRLIGLLGSHSNCGIFTLDSQNKLEAQYAAKRDAHASEVQDLKQQLEIKGNELRTLNATIDGLKSVNEELKVRNALPGGSVVSAVTNKRLRLTACLRCDVGWD